jgi:hypothetical protein
MCSVRDVYITHTIYSLVATKRSENFNVEIKTKRKTGDELRAFNSETETQHPLEQNTKLRNRDAYRTVLSPFQAANTV